MSKCVLIDVYMCVYIIFRGAQRTWNLPGISSRGDNFRGKNTRIMACVFKLREEHLHFE